MHTGEKAEIPFYSLYVRPSGEIYVNLDQRIEGDSFSGTVVVEKLGYGFRLYLPSDLRSKQKINKSSYLRVPWRWLMGIRPVVDLVLVEQPNAVAQTA